VLFVILVWLLFNTKNFHYAQKRKVKNLHRFAKEGELAAQQELAAAYRKGKQVKKNCQKAAFWYQKAAFSGDEEAEGYLKKFFEMKENKQNNKC